MRLAFAFPLGLALTSPAAAQEISAGIYTHGVNTPFTLDTGERGVDLQAGYRFSGIEALSAIGKPAPYLIASLNTRGDTSFAGAGLAWTIGKGPVYLRPGVGLVIHDGPSNRINASRTHTELGSRVLCGSARKTRAMISSQKPSDPR